MASRYGESPAPDRPEHRPDLGPVTRASDEGRGILEPPVPFLETLFLVGTDRADLVEFQKALTATP